MMGLGSEFELNRNRNWNGVAPPATCVACGRLAPATPLQL